MYIILNKEQVKINNLWINIFLNIYNNKANFPWNITIEVRTSEKALKSFLNKNKVKLQTCLINITIKFPQDKTIKLITCRDNILMIAAAAKGRGWERERV